MLKRSLLALSALLLTGCVVLHHVKIHSVDFVTCVDGTKQLSVADCHSRGGMAPTRGNQ